MIVVRSATSSSHFPLSSGSDDQPPTIVTFMSASLGRRRGFCSSQPIRVCGPTMAAVKLELQLFVSFFRRRDHRPGEVGVGVLPGAPRVQAPARGSTSGPRRGSRSARAPARWITSRQPSSRIPGGTHASWSARRPRRPARHEPWALDPMSPLNGAAAQGRSRTGDDRIFPVPFSTGDTAHGRGGTCLCRCRGLLYDNRDWQQGNRARRRRGWGRGSSPGACST
jgi:hypothetical protein